MNVLSLFDGMSCCQIALNRAGIKYDKYYASEVNKYAIAVTQANYPDTVHLGDINNFTSWDVDWRSIGLVVAGSPCQGFSFAGKQLAFDDPRSKLFFAFVNILRLIQSVNPSVKFLLENVCMKKQYQQIITDHLGVEPIFINSALVSAQNRKRLYWTNITNIKEPIDKGITWGDVRERNVIIENCDSPENEQAIAAMRGRYLIDGKRQDGKQKTQGLTKQYIEFRYDGKTNALTTVAKDNVVVPFTLPNRILADEFFFRYMTPVECERLQTVPDNYTAYVSNNQRYRMLGNGFTVDVIAHILRHMEDKI